MKLLALLFLFFGSTSFAHTKLLMIGGGVRPPEAMNEFVKAAGGEKANILICSWASETREGAENIRSELLLNHPLHVEILPTFPMKSEDENKLKTLIQSATGIFFTGGDQNRLMKAIFAEKLKDVLKTAYQNGVAFGGTSAGTAIMSERMITGDGDLTVLDGAKTPLAEGLGLLPSEIIVDQHFIVRQRFNRLASLVLGHENTFGIGIDEGTALFVMNNRIAKVIGPTQVLLISRASSKKLSVEIRSNHEKFNLFGLKD